MTWLHTWSGLLLGFVLMAAFFFGALSVFDREIDRWAMPATRFEPQPMPSFDRVLRPAFERLTTPDRNELAEHGRPEQLTVQEWSAYTTHRDPVLTIYTGFALPKAPASAPLLYGHRTLDPRDGRELSAGDLKIGSEFFYPLHYSLQLAFAQLGIWIVGLAALAMLVALVSGVVIHRRIFRELFTFRPGMGQRAVLDLHNLTGVVALPFHFFFALTGLILSAEVFLPLSTTTLLPLAEAHRLAEAAHTGLPAQKAGVAAALGSVDAMVRDAQHRWQQRGMSGEVGYLVVRFPGDANATVSVYRAGTDQVALTGLGIHYRAATGERIREDPEPPAIEQAMSFLYGLHLQQFRHWPLRFLYLFGGLAGCVCIATGFLFFVQKRRQAHARQGQAGLTWVDTFAVTTVTGMVIAALAMLVGNRLLPEGVPDRDGWERAVFWGAWLAACLHAAWRCRSSSARAWREQCAAVAVLALAAPLLNALTTGDHLLATVSAGNWPVAGVDLAWLAISLGAVTAWRRLSVVAPPEGADVVTRLT